MKKEIQCKDCCGQGILDQDSPDVPCPICEGTETTTINVIEKDGEELELKPQEYLSPTSINAYFKCPRCYFYQYIAKAKQPPSIHLVKGIIVHEVLEYFFKKYNKDMATHYYNLYESSIKRHQKELDNLSLSEEEMKAHMEDMNNIINEYWESFKRKIKNMIATGKAQGESHAFYLSKPKFRELWIQNDDLKVRGYIDRVNTDFNGIVTVGDYKTSKKFGIGFPMDYKRQLSIYAICYKEKFGQAPDFVAVDFLRYGETYFLEVTPNLIQFARDTITEVYKKTRSTNIEDYPITTGNTKWCNFGDLHDGTKDWKKEIRLQRMKEKLEKNKETPKKEEPVESSIPKRVEKDDN